jgi:hypothetical protein
MTVSDAQRGSTRPSTNDLWASIEQTLMTSDFSCRIARVKREIAAFRTSFAMQELEIQLQDGQTMAVMFKDSSWQALEGQARHVKPRFLHDLIRETQTYRTILVPSTVHCSNFHGADINEDLGSTGCPRICPCLRLIHHEWQMEAGGKLGRRNACTNRQFCRLARTSASSAFVDLCRRLLPAVGCPRLGIHQRKWNRASGLTSGL